MTDDRGLYANIDDITVSQIPGGPQVIDISPTAPIYRRSQSGQGFRAVNRSAVPADVQRRQAAAADAAAKAAAQRQAELNRQARVEAIREQGRKQQEIGKLRQQREETQGRRSFVSQVVDRIRDPYGRKDLRRTRDVVVKKGTEKVQEVQKKPFRVTISPSFTPIRFGEPAENIAYRKATGKNLPGYIVARSDVAKQNLETGNLAERSLGLLYPSTRGQLTGTVVTGAALTGSPAAIRTAFNVGIAIYGGATAFNPTKLPEERIAGGVLLVGGVGGAAFETTPYVRGLIARGTGAKTLKTKVTPSDDISQQLFGAERQVLEGVPSQSGGIDIGIIPEGRGFGFSQSIQKSQVGTRGTITTSARDLVKTGQGAIDDPRLLGQRQGTSFVDVQPGPEGLGLFFTPTPQGSGAARLSRLGLETGFFTKPNIKAQVGFKRERPQIVFEEGKLIENIGYAGTSELETTIGAGAVLKTEPRGSAVLKGQKVEIFEIVKATPGVKTPKTKGTVSSAPFGRVNPTAALTGTLRLRTPRRSGSGRTKSIPSVNRGTITTTTPRISTPKTPGPTIRTPTRKTPPISPPRITRLTTPPSPPTTPLIEFSRPSRRKGKRELYSPDKRKKKGIGGFLTVQLRRFGKFKTIGTAKTPEQAVSIGRSAAATTLGATFRVKGAGNIRTPKGFYQKGPGTFIEKTKFRLSTRGELGEIQTAKRRSK